MFLPSNFKNYALVCPPTNSVVHGLRMSKALEMEPVNPLLAKKQHTDYCRALRGFGYTLMAMRPCRQYPDSVFVEDPAVIIGGMLVISRLQNPKRQGEESRHEKFLSRFFDPRRIFRIEPPGFVEGGDVLVTSDCLYIGVSKRTNVEGVHQLARFAWDTCRLLSVTFEIPGHFLHLKGEASFHEKFGRKFLTASEVIAPHFAKSNYTLIKTPADELYGGNNISVPDGRILSHAWCQKTHKLLAANGFQVQPIDLGEYPKINGAMSCLSKLFTAPAIV